MFLCLYVLCSLHLTGAMESGIVGGHEAVPHSRPYMVSLQLNKNHRCGGMLIRKDYVLTSAHCVDKIGCSQNHQLEVVLGAHNIMAREFGQQRIRVQKCVKHPSYIENERHHDIMLVKLKTNATLNNTVKVIPLPEKNKNIPANQKCSIAGWGAKVPSGSASSVLQEVTLKLQFNFECKKIWEMYFDSQHMICTSSDGRKSFCQGDSGGPLICKNKPVGLAAYTLADNCANRKYPVVYMKIPYFVPWIKQVIG